MNESQAERVKFRSPWVDSIPLGWDQVKLGHISKIYSGGTPDKKIEEYWTNGTVPWLNSGTLNQGLITEVSEFISEQALANSSARWVPAGSLVMALAGQGKTKGMVAQLGIDATCNQSMAAIVIDDDHPRYMMYWLSSNYRNIRGIASDDTRDGLNLTNLKGILCPRPPSDEQIAIAAYLDAETKRIDELIAGKENLLELVEEIRLSTIYDVITKGLNSGVEMVETGVSWIGQAPAHWTVKSIKRLSTVKRGASPRPIDDDRYFDDAGE
jgi:type I restriction enzyme S subunit